MPRSMLFAAIPAVVKCVWKTNYFTGQDTAQRYARGRPYFHSPVVRKIAELLRLEKPVPAVLDAACGTGRSSVALTKVAFRVVGVDSSAGMLAQAPCDDRIEYVEASAEVLSFVEGAFDLVTVASSFHWFDRARFLREARRVLPQPPKAKKNASSSLRIPS